MVTKDRYELFVRAAGSGGDKNTTLVIVLVIVIVIPDHIHLLVLLLLVFILVLILVVIIIIIMITIPRSIMVDYSNKATSTFSIVRPSSLGYSDPSLTNLSFLPFAFCKPRTRYSIKRS